MNTPLTQPPSSASTVEALTRIGPTRLVLVVTLVAVHGLVRLAERTLPAFVLEWGAGPITVGLLASVALAVSVGVQVADVDGDSSRAIWLVATVFAAAGLLVWAGATSLDAVLGTPLTAIGWLLVGIVLLAPWHARGPGRLLSVGDGSMAVASGRGRSDSSDGGQLRLVAGALGIGGGAVLAMAAFAIADTIQAGFTVLATVGAAIALVAGVTLGVARVERTNRSETASETELEADTTRESQYDSAAGGNSPLEGEREGRSQTADGDDGGAHTGAVGGGEHEADTGDDAGVLDTLEDDLETARRTFATLSEDARGAILGDSFARFAVVMASLYVVFLVVDYHAVVVSVGSVTLSPIATFCLFVLAEAAGGVLGVGIGPTLATVADRRWVFAGGVAILSLVFLALTASSNPAVLALLFALFGFRTALEPLRPTRATGAVDPTAVEAANGVTTAETTDGTEPTTADGTDGTTTRATGTVPKTTSIRTVLRLGLVPAPLIGGVLYAIDPVVAFALASTVGLVGVRELLGPLRVD